MLLKKIKIKNFRSIEEIDLEINTTLKVLVGKNESGKSNIIKALLLLSKDEFINKDDIREPLPDEIISPDSFVRFTFEADQKEKDLIYEKIRPLFDSSVNIDEELFQEGTNKYTLRQFCDLRSEVLYSANLATDEKGYRIWTFDENKYSFTKNLVITKSSKENNSVSIDDSFTLNDSLYEKLSVSYIDRLLNNYKLKFLEATHPEVIYWFYKEENLLPSSINALDFSNDPDTCIPLKNLFQLAGVTDITASLLNARNSPPNKYRNFLDRIANHSTKHFHDIWKEYNEISFSFEPNGDLIEIGIREKNRYTFKQRSDGFKRFITFLLMVSASVKSSQLSNALILVDEPDVSLHPAGVRYLRDELKKISDKNIVVAATHSIFMINGDHVEDYLMVSKQEEKTNVELPTEVSIASEEVLYRALDFSVYELIKDTNLLFEGWRDKKLFKVALSKVPAEFKELKDFYKEIGITHTNGVKNIKNIAPIFELINKKCFIISDNDKAAKDKQKEFNREKNSGTWLRYDEIDDQSTAITGEDFVEQDLIEKTITKLSKKYLNITGLPDYTLRKGIIANLDAWLRPQVSADEVSTYIDEFKSSIFDSLKPSDISKSYYHLLKKLSAHISHNP